MFDLHDLAIPAVAAPMAGGVSTPELVAAAAHAGGLGFLAAGYQHVPDLLAQIAATRRLGAESLGVNVFVPGPQADLAAARAYRDRLRPLAESLGVDLPEPRDDDDGYAAKCDALLSDPVPVVSFTFGCPDAGLVRRLQEVGTAVLVTVTTPQEAAQAAAAGADALVVQGPDAGGHRATFDPAVTPPDLPLDELLPAVRAVTDLPLVATGGLGTRDAIRRALRSAAAVQVGTALLDSDEAGTNAAYRRGLREGPYTETVLTRSFSGRWARGLRNGFVKKFGDGAPNAYPAVNQVTGPIRRAAAAAGDPDLLSLWAGTGWRTMPSGPAAAILDTLLG